MLYYFIDEDKKGCETSSTCAGNEGKPQLRVAVTNSYAYPDLVSILLQAHLRIIVINLNRKSFTHGILLFYLACQLILGGVPAHAYSLSL